MMTQTQEEVQAELKKMRDEREKRLKDMQEKANTPLPQKGA